MEKFLEDNFFYFKSQGDWLKEFNINAAVIAYDVAHTLFLRLMKIRGVEVGV